MELLARGWKNWPHVGTIGHENLTYFFVGTIGHKKKCTEKLKNLGYFECKNHDYWYLDLTKLDETLYILRKVIGCSFATISKFVRYPTSVWEIWFCGNRYKWVSNHFKFWIKNHFSTQITAKWNNENYRLYCWTSYKNVDWCSPMNLLMKANQQVRTLLIVRSFIKISLV